MVIRSDYLLSYLPLNADKFSHRLIMEKCCLMDSAFTFDRILVNLADYQVRHKILGEFEFWPDRTNFGDTCPCSGHNMFNFNGIFINFADNRDRYKILGEFLFRPDQTIHFGVTCP